MNPILLIGIGGVVVFIILLFIFKKRSQRIVLFLLFLIGGAGAGWYGYKEYNRTNKDLENVKADFSLASNDLIKEYKANDSLADKKYLGKIIEVSGNVKKIEKDDTGYFTIILGDTTSLSSVRCSIDTVHQQDAAELKEGSSAILRGACTGFKKNELLGEDLGSDVELNRCAIIKKKN